MARHPSQEGINLLVGHLTPDERRQVDDVLAYMSEKAGPGNPNGYLAEGSIASLLNKQPPRIRQVFALFQDAAQTPRTMPFTEKWGERDYSEAAGLDPDVSETVLAALDGQEVTSRVIDRLGGSDADHPSNEPLTTKEILSAAYDMHTESEGGEL